jgi:hypothetical protein
MNCFQVEVRGAIFTIWAPTLSDALETFMIDMELYEVPKDAIKCSPVVCIDMPDNITPGF